ncbi:MAG: thymidine phosphorylase [Clostridia bacterium]|nr:thymidine phosphorylase [Clostridia bacterium]
MRIFDIIQHKKEGRELSEEEIRFFIEGYTCGDVPDYQASALCMAICLRGMTEKETAILTDAMTKSGDSVDLSEFGDLSLDKHSTGGVGDKTSLIVAPTVASLGGVVAKMSGRGLGHTGGTIDKLESIPGYRTEISPDEFLGISRRVGVCVAGQTGNLAPADKKLYALRDVTATVDSIPLIASSIMSKKLAAGAHSIVLDVKTGSGAFMKTPEASEQLAKAMISVGENCGRRVRALVTNMDVPLGNKIGNSLEVKEAVEVLRDGLRGDLYEICVALASNMICLSHKIDISEAQTRVENAISSGAAFAKMKEWIAAQGGDTRVLDDLSLLPDAPFKHTVKAERSGYIAHMNTEDIGVSASLLGAGRVSKTDVIDLSAGIELLAKTGDFVKAGQPLAILHASKESLFDAAERKLLDALTFSEEKPEKQKLIYATL